MLGKLYLLGHPVGHSKSPAMHNAAYRALGLDWEYGLMDRADEEGARAFLDGRGWLACNVTTPWKPLAYQAAVRRSVESELALGANVLVNWDGVLHADNTDGRGCAAYLKRCGADLVRVKKLLRENYTEYRAKADTTCRAEIFMDGYAFSECDAKGLDSPTIVGAQAANELLNISGIKASFVFTKLNDTVYVSARSIDEVNVQLICERLGGGGHLSVAGVQMKNISVEEAMTRVKETIRLMLKEGAI